MTLTQEISLDIYEASMFEYINAKQEDNISRVLIITLTANGSPLKPDPRKAKAYFRATKPDRTGVEDQAAIGEDGKITVKLTDQTLACEGDVAAEITIVEGREILTSATFYIQVERRHGGRSIPSTNEFLVMVEAAEKAEAAASAANDAAEAATAAEKLRTSDEAARKEAERARVDAEAKRVKAEQGRDTAEQGRVRAEAGRATAEGTRQDQEDARVNAEAKREADFAASKRAADTAAAAANGAADKINGLTVAAHKVAAGGTPTVTKTDTEGHIALDFGLVIGDTGAKGDKGAKGDTGPRGSSLLHITTEPSAYTTATGGFTPAYRIALSTVKTQSGVSTALAGDVLEYSYYHYPVGYVDGSYVYTGAHVSIRGAAGAAGAAGPKGESGATGPAGPAGANGTNGKDGVSPTVTTSKSGKVTTITIRDASGTKTATINDGADGAAGARGTAGAKGDTGPRGFGLLHITTEPSAYTTATGGFTPAYRIALSTVKTQSGVSTALAGDVLEYSYYHYPVGYVDGSYVYTGARVSIRGATGAAGAAGAAGPKGESGATGPAGPAGANGTNGKDGVSPTVTTSKSGKVTTITIRDASGTKTATINDGADGAAGAKGAAGIAAGFGTPTATVGTGTGTPTVKVTASGDNTAKVFTFAFDGLKGAKGETGATGAKGEKGDAGPNTVSTSTTTNINGILKGNGSKVSAAAAGDLFLAAHPVGAYYWSGTATSPASLFGGTWTQIKDRFVLAAGDTYAVGAAGGAATVTLTVQQIPSHAHPVYMAQSGDTAYWGPNAVSQQGTNSNYTGYAGGGQAHENMPPYIAAYCWRRTA